MKKAYWIAGGIVAFFAWRASQAAAVAKAQDKTTVNVSDPAAFIPANGMWEMFNGTPLSFMTPLMSPNAQASFIEVTDGTAAKALQ